MTTHTRKSDSEFSRSPKRSRIEIDSSEPEEDLLEEMESESEEHHSEEGVGNEPEEESSEESEPEEDPPEEDRDNEPEEELSEEREVSEEKRMRDPRNIGISERVRIIRTPRKRVRPPVRVTLRAVQPEVSPPETTVTGKPVPSAEETTQEETAQAQNNEEEGLAWEARVAHHDQLLTAYAFHSEVIEGRGEENRRRLETLSTMTCLLIGMILLNVVISLWMIGGRR